MAEQLSYDEVVESLYNFDRATLRRIAYEALLISDGPDRVEGSVEGTSIAVTISLTGGKKPAWIFAVWDNNQ